MALHPKYLLYFSVRSPFARRVRVAFQKLNIGYEGREINVFEPPADFMQANPLGLLPVLVIRQGNEEISVPDSSTILEYLHEQYGGKIWPSEPAVKIQVRAASTFATGLMTETVRWYLENQRTIPSAEWNQEYLENLDRTLAWIQSTSLKGLPWKVSDFQLTQAGYDLCIALEYMRLRLRGLAWEEKYPDLSRFLELHRNRQDLAGTAPPL